MADEKTTPTWGYSKGDSQIFDLKPGENLPSGYYDNPAKVPGSAAQKAYIADAEAEGAEIPPEFMPKKSGAPIDKTDR
jgi:hypothetical protein